MRQLKNHLYDQVARIGKAVASPKRLELIELLCQALALTFVDPLVLTES